MHKMSQNLQKIAFINEHVHVVKYKNICTILKKTPHEIETIVIVKK